MNARTFFGKGSGRKDVYFIGLAVDRHTKKFASAEPLIFLNVKLLMEVLLDETIGRMCHLSITGTKKQTWQAAQERGHPSEADALRV